MSNKPRLVNPKDRGAHRNNNDNDMRSENQNVFKDTIDYSVSPITIDYVVPKPLLYDNDMLNSLVENITPRYSDMIVTVVNNDTFDTAKKLIDDGETTSKKIMVLNMACAYKPGGGVRNGAMAQEEALFRRSNYFVHLPVDLYQLGSEEVILSREVLIFKDKFNKNIAKPYTLNCIACAAIRKPKVKTLSNGVLTYSVASHRKKMETKIENIFLTAYLNNYDTLVLGALGCGAYENPIMEVTNIFLNTLNKFRGCFKKVTFAVLSWGSNTNFKLFHEHVEIAYNADSKLNK
jgi:uncharacterized protein (TIGR02452 family)